MNFTREPLIETIITPKEGYKLLVRSSKAGGQEEYLVDALEVVSFGHSFFFRCTERPNCFLVPVGDYEVGEVKETRVVLKNVAYERSIKIGGGRDGPLRSPREPKADKIQEPASADTLAPTPSAEPLPRNDRKRDRRRHRRRGDERDWNKPRSEHQDPSTESSTTPEGGGAHHDETQVSSSMFTSLIPPPSTLISDTISRYKDFAISQGPSSVSQVAPEEIISDVTISMTSRLETEDSTDDET